MEAFVKALLSDSSCSSSAEDSSDKGSGRTRSGDGGYASGVVDSSDRGLDDGVGRTCNVDGGHGECGLGGGWERFLAIINDTT